MISNVVVKLADRYPTEAEKARVREYLATLRERRTALEEMRIHGDAIAVATVDRARKTYPQFERFHGEGFAKGVRDLKMSMAFCANGAFVGETDFLDNAWLHWYRTIIKSFHPTPQFMRDTFRWWDEEMKARVSPMAYMYLKPVLDHIAARLTNLPEPVRAEVGERIGRPAV